MFVVFDLDGTLSDDEARNRKHACPERGYPHLRADIDWDAFYLDCYMDKPIEHAIACLNALFNAGNAVAIWTARGEVSRQLTIDWLIDQGVHPTVAKYYLRMRPHSDHRSSPDLKSAWADRFGVPDLVFEDRDCMVSMWRARGIPCFQVAVAAY